MDNRNKIIPLAGKIKALCVIFSLIEAVLAYGLYVISTETIYMDDNTVMPAGFKITFTVVATVVFLGVLGIIAPLLHRIFTRRGAMTLTPDGIKDTFLVFNFAAFWTTFKIKELPWAAIYPKENDALLDEVFETFSVNLDLVPYESTNRIAKLLLKFGGFNASVAKNGFKEIIQYKTALENRDFPT